MLDGEESCLQAESKDVRYQNTPEGLGLTSWLGATLTSPTHFVQAWAALVDCVSELEGLEEGPATIDSILYSVHV